MRRLLLSCCLLVPFAALSPVARAGTHADALAQCLVQATTPADQKVVLRWAFATMALDPEVASMASITPEQRQAVNRAAGTLVSELLTRSCSGPVRQTLSYEGPQGVQAAFESWGRWAITGLVSEPHVQQGMGELLQYLDIGRLMMLLPSGSS